MHQTLHLYSEDHPERLAGSTVLMGVDNKTLHGQFKRGRARNTVMHKTIIDLFWPQARKNFLLRWVHSARNAEADGVSRPGSDEYVRLGPLVFNEL